MKPHNCPTSQAADRKTVVLRLWSRINFLTYPNLCTTGQTLWDFHLLLRSLVQSQKGRSGRYP